MGLHGLLKQVRVFMFCCPNLTVLFRVGTKTSILERILERFSCRFRHRHTWIGFFDADEFLWLSNRTVAGNSRIPSINNFLKKYEQYGGLGVNWRLFGSNGLRRRSELPVVEAFTAAFPASHNHNRHVKMFANTRHAIGLLLNPHSLVVKNTSSSPVVNEHFTPFHGPATASASHDNVALLHYILKSKSEFGQKIARSSPTRNTRSWGFFQHYNAQATETWDGAVWLSQACDMRAKLESLTKHYSRIRALRSLVQS